MPQPEQQRNGIRKTVIHDFYAANRVEGYSWEALHMFYERLVQNGLPCEPLRDLVQAITASPYASLLHGITSHTDLLVFGYTPFELHREMVRIEYLYQEKQFFFTYEEHPWRSLLAWRKICSAAEGKQIFEHLIIHTVKWVPMEFRRARAREYAQAGFSQAF